MKAICLKQPYASLVIDGIKKLETRTWRTKHRGLLGICSSMKPDREAEERLGCKGQPLGVFLGTINLKACRRFEPADAADACFPWSPGRFAWEIDEPTRQPHKKVKGQLGIFDLAGAILKAEE